MTEPAGGPRSPRPFTIEVPEAELARLRDRLAMTRWSDHPPAESVVPWASGVELGYLRELVDHWRDRFDWRAQERALNAFAQYTASVGGIELHFIHQPGVGPDPMPLLLPHGWPSSVWEFHELIPMLTDPARFGGDARDAFTVVAPSLPGYGFSHAPGQRRQGVDEMADTFAELMRDVLGHRRFAMAGGDWGAYITARMAHVHPGLLHGILLTLLPMRRVWTPPPDPTPEERDYVEQIRHWEAEERGYAIIQATRPQTLAYGLADSPVGLAAWIVEKFRRWSDCGGDVETRFSKDELLANVTIYWVTGTIGSSMWPYYAREHGGWSLSDVVAAGGRIEVPTAYALFPAEIIRPPRGVVEEAFDLRRFTRMPSGGHFAALEEPALLAGELREWFRPFRGAGA